MDKAEGAEGRPTPGGALTGEPIRGETSLTVDDFKSVWIELPSVRKMLVWLLALAVALPLAMWFRSPETLGMTLLVTPLLLLALVYGVMRGRTRWATAALRGPEARVVEYLFDGSGYHVKEPGGEGHLEWTMLHGHAEIDGAFLIYTTPQIVAIIPKRAFSIADQARLRDALVAKVPRRKVGGDGGAKKLLLLWGLLILAFVAIWHFLNPK